MNEQQLRDLLREAADFWGHYSSLNEGAQDDMAQEKSDMLDRMRNALAQPAAPAEPSSAVTWIPVAEHLPDAETTVLIAHDDDVTLGWFDDDGPRWWECESGELAHGVTHWADLPAAPEDKP